MQLFSFADFSRLTGGCGNVDLRLMEAEKIISPPRTRAGRVFTQSDVDAATAWLAEHRKPRQQRA
jgi:hypothetical protein